MSLDKLINHCWQDQLIFISHLALVAFIVLYRAVNVGLIRNSGRHGWVQMFSS